MIMPSIPIHGMERANLQIMKMMRERGADVVFVTRRTYGEKLQREVERLGCSWRAAPVEKRLHLTKDPREMLAVLRVWARGAWGIWRIYKEYRPTHVYVTNLSNFLFALPVLIQAKGPVIFRPPNPPDTGLPAAKQRLSDWIWRHCVGRLSDVIVCNSRYTLSRVEAAGVRAKDARVIYNGASDPSQRETGDAPKVNRDRFNVVFIGRIKPAKGVKELFEVARRLVREEDDVDFYFAGDYTWQNPFAQELVQRVRDENLQSRIHFIGEIKDVFALLVQCDLHVWPSVSDGETFPNVVLEAKSQGVPTVAFPTAGLPEAVMHLVDGYVCRERSADALYEGIRYFLDHPGALKAAKEAAGKSAERFSSERIAGQWIAVFASRTWG